MSKTLAVAAMAATVLALTSCASNDPAERERTTRQAAKDACANLTADTPRATIDRCKAAGAAASEARIRNRATKYPEAKTTAEQQFLAAIELDGGAGSTNAKLTEFQRRANLSIGRLVCRLYKDGHPDLPDGRFTARDAADALVLDFHQKPGDAKYYVEQYIPVLCPDEAQLAGKVGPYRPMS